MKHLGSIPGGMATDLPLLHRCRLPNAKVRSSASASAEDGRFGHDSRHVMRQKMAAAGLLPMLLPDGRLVRQKASLALNKRANGGHW